MHHAMKSSSVRRGLGGLAILLLAGGCGGSDASREDADAALAAARSPRDQFWASLAALCGLAFPGTLVEDTSGGGLFEGQELVMHVRQCSEDEIRVPFHVGENRSRAWIFTRTEEGIRLKHDHRHEDGSEDEVTQYGGDTAGEGSAMRQEFPADAFTAELIPAAATNVWTVEIHPGHMFAYALRREGTDRRVRVEFDLTRPVEPPPPPWGS
jgi:hypothetical protein